MAYRSSNSTATVLFFALGCLAAPAAAEPTSSHEASAAPDKAKADALIEKGVALRRQGREHEALERFRQAYELDPSPRALGQMGLAAKSLRLYVEAEQYLDGALSATGDAWVEKNRRALEQARALVARNVASVRVTTNAPHAKLLVNGSLAGELPMSRPLRVPAGALHLEVRAPGFAPKRLERTALAGRLDEIRVKLEPLPRQASSQPAPARPAGPHPRPPLHEQGGPSSSSRDTWTLVAGGVGLAGVALGTYMGLHAMDLSSQRDDVCPEPTCPTARGVELDRDARRAATWSDVGFGVGIAGLGAAAVLWFTRPGDAPESHAGVVLRVGPRGAYAGMGFPL